MNYTLCSGDFQRTKLLFASQTENHKARFAQRFDRKASVNANNDVKVVTK